MQGAVLGTEDQAGNKMGSSFTLEDFTFKQLITQNIIHVSLTKCSHGCYVNIYVNKVTVIPLGQGGAFLRK